MLCLQEEATVKLKGGPEGRRGTRGWRLDWQGAVGRGLGWEGGLISSGQHEEERAGGRGVCVWIQVWCLRHPDGDIRGRWLQEAQKRKMVETKV